MNSASAIAAQGVARLRERAARQLLLDANADTPIRAEVLETYLDACSFFADSGASHAAAIEARQALAVAREKIATVLGCEPDALHFTSGGTEADAVAMASLPPTVMISSIEHAAVAKAIDGAIRLAVPRSGFIDPNMVSRCLAPGVRGLSVVAASNETGAIQPVSSLAAIARRHGVVFHTDAIQLPGRADVDVHELGADIVTFSSHKVGAPGGVGLVVTPFGAPLSRSWQEPVPNVAGIVALAHAFELLPDAAARAAMADARDALEREILRQVADTWVVAVDGPRLANTTCIAFPGCEGEAILMALDVRDIAVSTGSACSSGSIEASPILLGMGLTAKEAKSTARFSLARPLIRSEIDSVAVTVADVVRQARAMPA